MQYPRQNPSKTGGMVGDQQQQPYFGIRGHGIHLYSDSHYSRKPPLPISAGLEADNQHVLAYQSLAQYNRYQEDEMASASIPPFHEESTKFLPVSPNFILAKYQHMLTAMEQREILEYPNIYYFGQNAVDSSTGKMLKRLPSAAEQNNFGLDDDRGDYNCTLKDHIAYRYELIDVLGKGSFGQVMKAFDHLMQTFVALKIIRNKKRFHHQALIEVKILERIKKTDVDNGANVIKIQESFYFRKHLCITFELLSMNLYEFIKSNNFRGFSVGLIRRFAIQILKCLRLLQQQRIIHCDLKPENVLLCNATKSQIKVIDFGSSCLENERLYTYIQSRFYRSPEVILGLEYGLPIDMWSLGCILVELLTGNPIFPGENENEQLMCMMEVLGVPPLRIILAASRRKTFFHSTNRPRISPNSKGIVRHPGSKTLETILQSAAQQTDFINFVRRCLEWDSAERMSPDEALRHPWICGGEMPGPSLAPSYHQHGFYQQQQQQIFSSPKYPPVAYHNNQLYNNMYHNGSQQLVAANLNSSGISAATRRSGPTAIRSHDGYSYYHQAGSNIERVVPPMLTSNGHPSPGQRESGNNRHFLPQLDARGSTGGLVGQPATNYNYPNGKGGLGGPTGTKSSDSPHSSSSSSLLTRFASGFALPKPFSRRGGSNKGNK